MFELSAVLVLLAVSSIQCNMTSVCSRNQSMSYLDIAIDMITKAKLNTSTCKDCGGGLRAKDCADIIQMGNKKSGVYKIQPVNRLTEDKTVNVYCDMNTDGGGWTVIQRRGDFQRPYDFFYKNWTDYKEGFGNLEKDFWLGNDNIFALTNQKGYSARFDLKDVEQQKRYALYDKFWIDDENQNYTLHISDYMGDAGDSMISVHNIRKFSTKDQNNDDWGWGKNCAADDKGGWWYNSSPPCHHANLNGLYLKGKLNKTHEYQGISWYSWKGHRESLEWTEIKIRPKNFRRPSNFSRPSDFVDTPM